MPVAHILIIVTLGYGNGFTWPIVSMQRFESRAACESAAKAIDRRIDRAYRRMTDISMTCQPVQKDTP